MTSLAIVLVIVSALLHALWNYLGKVQTSPGLYFFFFTTLFSAVALTGTCFIFSDFVYIQFIGQWGWVFITGLCQTLYLVALANAYRYLELSSAYPIIRSLPVILLPMFMTVVLAKEYSFLEWLSFILIALGTLLLLPFKDLRFKNTGKGAIWVTLAALGTCGYSAIDFFVQKDWLSSLQTINPDTSQLEVSLLYICILNWSALLSMLPVLLLFYSSEPIPKFQRQHIYAGSMMTLSYLLILLAMNFADDVSAIVAFRQVSIPIGFLLGIFLIKESASTTKVMGISAICIGLVLLA